MIAYNASINNGYSISNNNVSCDNCRISHNSSNSSGNSTQTNSHFAASRLAGVELSAPESPTVSEYQQLPHTYHGSKSDGSGESSNVMSNSNGYNEIHTESQAALPPLYSNFNISDELFDYFNGFLEVATEEYQQQQQQLQSHHESHQAQQQYFSESTALNFTNITPTISSFTTSDPVFLDILEALPNDRVSLLSFLFLFSFATVFGNSLVILAVIRERYLHTATNYFITSLAVADCLVGLVVMPFSALYEVLENTWFFGTDWCDIWRSLDVLFSTASILNLCVISLDRYWAITDPFSYPMRMTVKRAAGLICAVWVCSGAISFPAIMWWRAARDGEMPAYKCTFTEHLGYLVFSSTISFYLPLLVMVFTYCRIYRAAVIQTRSLKIGTKQVLMSSGELQLTLRIHRGGTTREPSTSSHHHVLPGGSNSGGGISSQHHHHHAHRPSHHTTPSSHHNHSLTGTTSSTPEEPEEEPLSALHNNGLARHRHMGKHFSLSRKLAKFAKEKKAAKTLGIVMGVFIVCWLPFFVVNLLSGFCMECIEHEEIVSAVVTWLGWINSCMNPVIYACWSRDFRRAFLRLLCVCCPRKIRRKYQPAMRSRSQLSSCSSCSSSSNCGHNAIQQPTLQLPARERNCTRCQSFHRHHHRQRRRSSGTQRIDFSSGDAGGNASHATRTIQAIVNIIPPRMISEQPPTTSQSPLSATQTALIVTGENSVANADIPGVGNIDCGVVDTHVGASCSSLLSLQPAGSVTTTPSPTSTLSAKQQQQNQTPSQQQQHTRNYKQSVGKHCTFVLTPTTIPIDKPCQASLFATTHYFKTNPQRRKTSFSSMNHHTPATKTATSSMMKFNSAADDIVDYEQTPKFVKSNIDDYCRVSNRSDDDNDECDDDIRIEDENEEIDDIVGEASISSTTSSLNIQAV